MENQEKKQKENQEYNQERNQERNQEHNQNNGLELLKKVIETNERNTEQGINYPGAEPRSISRQKV